MPFLTPELAMENEPGLAVFQSVVNPLFPKAQVQAIQKYEEYSHPLYLIKLSNQANLVLKTEPGHPTSLPRQEYHSLETEAEVLTLLAPNKIPYIPKILRFDTFNQAASASTTPFLLRHQLKGVPLSQIQSRLTFDECNYIDQQLGSAVRWLGQYTSHSFGRIHDVSSGGGKRSWPHAFLGFIESLLCDAEDMFIALPYADIRQQIARLAPALVDINGARLVVVDIGNKSNILVDPETKQLTAIADFGSAVWGDVLMADVFESPSLAFLEGFGKVSLEGESQRIRLQLYACYRHLTTIVKQYYRDRDDEEEMNARRGLTTSLADMAAISY